VRYLFDGFRDRYLNRSETTLDAYSARALARV
jgi:hypothetical protein